MSESTRTSWRPNADDTHVASDNEETSRTEESQHSDEDLVYDEQHGEWIDPETGEVVSEDEIDRGPEWRAYDAADRDEKSRVGAPTTKMMHDQGLSTNIGWADRDANGNALGTAQRQKMRRLRTWNERFRTRDSKERNLKQALGEIDRMASALGLPETVRETGSVIYRRALDENLLPGRSIEGVATASLYGAAKQANVPRSLDEFQRVSRVAKLELTRTYRYIVRELNLEIQPAEPAQYLPRFVSALEASSAVERTARKLLEHSNAQMVHSGKSPVGLAAAAIYAGGLLVGEELTQEAISQVTDISAVTIRSRYQDFFDALEKDELRNLRSEATA
ncbi:transcription initiation factor IIB family protein [Halorientalis brevis]|uniref:Transcription initiation factor IIB n=1 Tax=Halorientalis brevis TaxID=1126241 RepID=A0ABD6CI35_9EURY|nr:transcription initiation factor IIB 2 [Halorientalis brevis]